MCYLAKCGRSSYVKRYERNYGDDPPEPADFQGHSRSLEPTRIDQRLMTSFRLIHSNHGPIFRTVSEKNSDFRRKSQKFSHPCVFNALVKGVPLGIL